MFITTPLSGGSFVISEAMTLQSSTVSGAFLRLAGRSGCAGAAAPGSAAPGSAAPGDVGCEAGGGEAPSGALSGGEGGGAAPLEQAANRAAARRTPVNTALAVARGRMARILNGSAERRRGALRFPSPPAGNLSSPRRPSWRSRCSSSRPPPSPSSRRQAAIPSRSRSCAARSPQGGCPVGRGGTCDDAACRALYDCLEGAWTEAEACDSAGEPAGDRDAGAGGATGACEVVTLDRSGEAVGCSPALQQPDCPADAAETCVGTACWTGCIDFFLCTEEGWRAIAYCDEQGRVTVAP